MREWIAKKRDGDTHTAQEIQAIVAGYTQGTIPDYQMSAWLMACYLRGLNAQEMLALTEAMAHSGEQLDLSSLPQPTLDKHSTGGVGDKTSLVVVPLLASAGATLVKMSGRGLGFTGGTVDKLESIPGYRTEMSVAEMLEQVRRVGCCLVGQSAQLVPADKKIYALRDATATVESIPLIASSIMSKKLAGGAQHIVLDVKVGSGAFMPTRERAQALAEALIAIGEGAGRKVRALLTDMSQPLGRTVGNALEVREAIQTLTPDQPYCPRFRELCLRLAGTALHLCQLAETPESGYAQAERLLSEGYALEKFRQLVEAQGGDPHVIDQPDERLPTAPIQHTVVAHRSGWVNAIHPRVVAEIALRLGAGRQTKEDTIDHAVGVEVLKSVGEPVRGGEPLMVLHARHHEALQNVLALAEGAFDIVDMPIEPTPVVLAVL
ncbi:MAG: thymidine phosphorylase [Fimbriimonadales bacterium]